jgi:hypothetical protein
LHFTFTKTQDTRGTFWFYHSSYFEFQEILNFVHERTEVEIVSKKESRKTCPVSPLWRGEIHRLEREIGHSDAM